MKKLIRKILFGSTPVCEYATVTVENITEKVILKTETALIDISQTQWLLCLQPIVIGIWLNNRDSTFFSESKKNKIYFCGATEEIRKSAAVVEINIIEKIIERDGTLFLAEAGKTILKHINAVRTKLLFNKFYKKPQWPFDKYKALAAAYSYPRKVRLVSFKEGEYFNIFPMDLLGVIPQSNRVVFGLRHTNIVLQKIINAKKIVVSEIGYEHKETIYQLGKYHGTAPPSINDLSFKTLTTDQFGFYIPQWAESYKEINIIATADLGSHTLLWGEVINEKKLTGTQPHLFHIHFLHSLFLKKAGINYTAV